MKAVILAGGQGTRMGDLTKEIPKPMLQVGGMPILEHQIKLLARYQIREIFVLVNYLKESIIKYFGNGKDFGVNITYYEEEKPLGTVGGIKEIQNLLTDDFIVFYGDVLIDMHLGRLIAFHKYNESECTLVLHPNDHPYDSDLVEVNQNHQVVDFYSKPHPEDFLYKNMVNAGAYILTPAIFPYLEKGVKADFGRHIFPSIYKKLRMFGYNTAEYLKDMGTPNRWTEVENAWITGKVSRSNYENKQKAIFLDRDGVINEEAGLFNHPDKLKVFDFAADAIKTINSSDYKTIVVTNQPSIAKNIASFEELNLIHKKLETILGNQGAKIDELYFCPHHPDKGFPEERPEFKIDCFCRKPKPGMLLQAAGEFNIDLSESFIIGDTDKDILAGRNAGCTAIGVMTGFGVKSTTVLPDFLFKDLKEAVEFIVNEPHIKYYEYLSKEIKGSQTEPYFIGIGGNAKSGKSNFTQYLKLKLEREGKKVLVIHLDNWILDESERDNNMNVFDRFNLKKIESDFEKLSFGQEITISSRQIHPQWIKSKINYTYSGYEIIIIEGVVALSSKNLRNIYNKKIFLSISEEKRKQRIKEFYLWREKKENDIEKLYSKRSNDEYNLIEKESKFADLQINF